MCIRRRFGTIWENIPYPSIIESNDIDDDEDIENIFDILEPNEEIIVCRQCFAPIALTLTLMRTILLPNENGIVIERIHLLTDAFYEASREEQWRNEVHCYRCRTQLSYTEENIPTPIRGYRTDLLIGILNVHNIWFGRVENFRRAYENYIDSEVDRIVDQMQII